MVTNVSKESIASIFRVKLFELQVFFVYLFNDTVSNSQYKTSNDRTNNKLARKEAVVARCKVLRNLPGMTEEAHEKPQSG